MCDGELGRGRRGEGQEQDFTEIESVSQRPGGLFEDPADPFKEREDFPPSEPIGHRGGPVGASDEPVWPRAPR